MSEEKRGDQEAVRRILDMVKEGRLEPGEAETLIAGLMEKARKEEKPPSKPFSELVEAVEQVASRAAEWGKTVAREVTEHIQEGRSEDEEEAPVLKFGHQTEIEQEEEAEGLSAVEVINVNGSIELTGAGSGPVRVVARRHEQAGEREAGVEIRREADTLVVRTRPPSHLLQGQQGAVDYSVELPAHLSVRARTVNGSVRGTGLIADVSLKTVNGDVALEAGDDAQGEVRAKTVNGLISVSLKQLRAHADLKTVNGGIEAAISEELHGELHAKTLNGEVALLVPRGAAFTLKAGTGMSGSIVTDWGSGRRSFEHDVRGGGPALRLNTFTGDIRVRQGGAGEPGERRPEWEDPVDEVIEWEEPDEEGAGRDLEL